jgi:hypothetical protein
MSMKILGGLRNARDAIVAKTAPVARRPRIGRTLIALVATTALAGCYPRYDFRDFRPDCARAWCGFVASFPGKATTATREIPVGAARLPLTVNLVTVGDVRFAVLAFDLRPGSDAAAARAMLEKKLLDDVGATAGRRDRTTLRAADRSAIAAETFEAEGVQDGKPLKADARFTERDGRLIEILVVGPADVWSKDSGRQAIETFFTSVRLD